MSEGRAGKKQGGKGCPPEEAKLIRAAQQGDERAFETLMLRYEPPLRSLIQSQVRHHPHMEASDVLQEVRIRGWKNLHKFDFQYSYRSYVFGIAYYAVKPTPAPGDPDPDELPDTVAPQELEASPAVRELLEILLRCGGYPHQQVSMLHSVGLWGRSKPPKVQVAAEGARSSPQGVGTGIPHIKVPVTGDAARVVQELADSTLARATNLSQADLGSVLEWGRGYLPHAFSPLRERLRLRVRALFARDGQSARIFSDLLADIVGTTHLKDYFGSDARRSVSGWTYGVSKRTRAIVCGEFDCCDCKLPCP